MLLTISTTHQPATDLGHLLRKNPASVQSFELSFGRAHVFYPEATATRCTAALLMEIDPVGLVRNRRGPSGDRGTLDQYVNDRPYAASSFLSVALGDVFGSAMAGKSKDRPELVDQPLPLEVTVAAVPCHGGEAFLRRLFEPLGYELTVSGATLDEKFPEWGQSRYFHLELRATVPLRLLLTHLYVLVPVLDNEKHYWVGDDEVEKLLRRGEGWLESHPERELITRRYLKHRRHLVNDALSRLVPDAESAHEKESAHSAEEAAVEQTISLNEQRLTCVAGAIKASGAKRVLDLGCGEGRLVRELLRDRQYELITGMDVAWRALELARARLRLDRLPPMQQERVQFLHGSLIYRDKRLSGYDAAAVVEVVEHLDPPRLAAFERVLFEHARPALVVLTTPNAEYNVKWASLPAGKFRHKDHRFEWTREQFQTWAAAVADRFGYNVRYAPVGPEDAAVGAPTQMAIFERER